MIAFWLVSTQQTHPKQRTFGTAILLPAEQYPKLGWRIILTFILVLGLIILSLVAGRNPTADAATLDRAKQSKKVASSVNSRSPNRLLKSTTLQNDNTPLGLAFYYRWFDETSWSFEKLSDLPAQPYASRDRSAMGRHIEQAQRAGIDAFVVS